MFTNCTDISSVVTTPCTNINLITSILLIVGRWQTHLFPYRVWVLRYPDVVQENSTLIRSCLLITGSTCRIRTQTLKAPGPEKWADSHW